MSTKTKTFSTRLLEVKYFEVVRICLCALKFSEKIISHDFHPFAVAGLHVICGWPMCGSQVGTGSEAKGPGVIGPMEGGLRTYKKILGIFRGGIIKLFFQGGTPLTPYAKLPTYGADLLMA